MRARLAVVGAGGFAGHMVEQILALRDEYDVVAVCELPGKQTAAMEACAARNVRIYHDLERMLDAIAGRCDAVYVATPIPTHFAIASAALRAGLHVFLEKPPVPTIQQYDQLLAIERAAGKRTAVCFQALYTQSVRRLKTALRSGKYGAVRRIRAMGAWKRLDSYYARSPWAGELKLGDEWVLDGSLHNPFAHMMAVALYLASPEAAKMAEPAQVQAELYRAHHIAAEDTSSVRVLTDGQVEILFNATLCSADETEPTICVDCSEAAITYYNYTETTVCTPNGATERFQEPGPPHDAMLKRLAAAIGQSTPFDAPLTMCRPFTLVVNGAFDSCGAIHDIPTEYITRFDEDDSVATCIDGVENSLMAAHAQGKLLSEVNAPWASGRKGALIS